MNVRRCLPITTQIYTENGLKNIEDVDTTDNVLTLNGYKKVKNTFKQGKQKLISIILNNNQELRCTPNHKIAILNSINGQIEWIEAQNLKENNVILHTLEGCTGKSNCTIKEAYFYGVLNGDGCIDVRKSNGSAEIRIVFSNDETGRKIASKIDDYLQEEHIKSVDTFPKNGNYFHTIILSPSMARNLLIFKVPNQSPIIPEEIYKGTLECKLSYLAGLCDADGTPSRYNLCSSVYKSFLIEVQKIAASVGICTYIITRNRKDWKWKQENCLIIKGFLSKRRACKLINQYMVKQFPYKMEPCYDCTIPLQLVDEALEEGNITKTEYHQLKNCTHKMLIDYYPEFWSKIIPLQVEYIHDFGEEEETYDIEVEENHCFFAEGILVHNSAELLKGKIKDQTFINLKDLELNPDRADISWMSNNSAELEAPEDFECLGEVAKRVIKNSDLGIINRINMKQARVGKDDLIKYLLKEDPGTGFNPCGEQILEDKELCIVPETHPTRCIDENDWYQALEYATFYGVTVQLLPTHRPETNRIIAKNRRIGVSFADYSGWQLQNGVHNLTRYMREGYKLVRQKAKQYSEESGTPEPIRVSTVKPGGTGPKLPGVRSAINWPTHLYTLRRTRLGENSTMHRLLEKYGIKCIKDYYSDHTVVCEWPIYQGLEFLTSEGIKSLKSAEDISLWQQAMTIILVQREWSDNAVSNTLYFRPKWKLIKHFFALSTLDYNGIIKKSDNNIWADLDNHTHLYGIENFIKLKMAINEEEKVIILNDSGKSDQEKYKFTIKYSETVEGDIDELKIYEFDPKHEEDDVEPVLSAVVPHIKSLSLLPHTPEGVYIQMPEEKLTKQQYEELCAKMQKINWKELRYNISTDEKYCTGDLCERPL